MSRFGNDERNEPVYVADCYVVKETDAAFLIGHEGEESWIPKSKILNDDLKDEGDEGVLAIPRWLAEDRGWE